MPSVDSTTFIKHSLISKYCPLPRFSETLYLVLKETNLPPAPLSHPTSEFSPVRLDFVFRGAYSGLPIDRFLNKNIGIPGIPARPTLPYPSHPNDPASSPYDSSSLSVDIQSAPQSSNS